jgi:hypothetical protein
MVPFDERELTDEELSQVSGAGSSDQSDQAPLTLNFRDVDHISFRSDDNGGIKEQVFFTGGSTTTTPTTGS